MAKRKQQPNTNTTNTNNNDSQEPELQKPTTMEKPPPPQPQPPPSKPDEDSSEKVANLKSLNALLVKETVERREQVDSLLKSKSVLESEVTRYTDENQKLEEEKKLLEAKVKEAETLEKLALASLAEEVSSKRVLEEEMVKEKEDLEREVDLKVKEEKRLKALVEELEKSNGEDQEELREMTIAYNGVIEQKKVLQGQILEMKAEMERSVRERDEVEKAKRESDVEVARLRKTVEEIRDDVERERKKVEGVCGERDLIGRDLDVKVKEVEGLRLKVVELEERNSVAAELGERREKEMKKLVDEKAEKERRIESLVSEKVEVERSLEGSMKQVEGLSRKLRQLEEKSEGEKTMYEMKIRELEGEVEEFRASVASLKKEKEGLELKVDEIRVNYNEALVKGAELGRELGLVVEEKGEKERECELLLADKNSVVRRLEEALGQLESRAREIKVIGEEKSEVERVKVALEIQIEELQLEVARFESSESALRVSCEEQSEKINQLGYEVVCLKDNLGKVTAERDVVLKELELKKEEEAMLKVKVFELEKTVDEQSRKISQLGNDVVCLKGNVGKVTTERDGVLKELELKKEEEAMLKLKVLELEKSVEKGRQELEKLKKEHGSLSTGKKEKESQIQVLINEKSSLEKRLLKVEEDNKELISKVKSAEVLSGKALSMLKSTAEFVSGSEDASQNGNAGTVEEEIRPFVSELEAIKKAFKNKEKSDEELALQIKSLNNSLTEARKQKNIWTWLSSATTLFAAASFAYAARR